MNDERPVYCSFCGKSELQVEHIVKADDCAICNECIELCRDILGRQRLDWKDDQDLALKQLADSKEQD